MYYIQCAQYLADFKCSTLKRVIDLTCNSDHLNNIFLNAHLSMYLNCRVTSTAKDANNIRTRNIMPVHYCIIISFFEGNKVILNRKTEPNIMLLNVDASRI